MLQSPIPLTTQKYHYYWVHIKYLHTTSTKRIPQLHANFKFLILPRRMLARHLSWSVHISSCVKHKWSDLSTSTSMYTMMNAPQSYPLQNKNHKHHLRTSNKNSRPYRQLYYSMEMVSYLFCVGQVEWMTSHVTISVHMSNFMRGMLRATFCKCTHTHEWHGVIER